MATFQISAWWSTPLRRAVTLAAVGALVAAAGWWGLCGSSFGPLCKLGEADLLAQAEKRLQRNDFAGAQIDLRNVLRDNPQSARGRVLFAQALLGHGDAAGALQELDNARQHGAPDDATWEIQAAALLAQGRPEQVAAQFAGKRLADGGATARLQTAVARAQLALGDAAAAAAAIEAALAAVPDHVPARVLQARLMAVAGRRAEALQASDRLLAEAAQDAEAWLLRADLLAADPSPGENALTAYRKAVELGPRLAEAHGGLVNLLLRQGDANGAALAASGMRRALPGSPLATYLLALTAYLKGDLESAREQLQLLKLDSHPRLLLLAGTVESRVGNLAQAETYLLRALQSVPDDAHTRRELAALYLRRGQAERALGMLEPVLAASAAPADAQAWRLAGQAHLRMGQFDRADQAFKQVKRLQPNDRAVDLDAARLLMARGSVDAAIRALEASAQADPTGLDADMELVTTHMARGDHKAALAVAEGMTRKAPDAAVTWLLRARIQALAGDAAGARESFVAASRRDPQDLQAVRGLAELDLAAGRPDVAKGCYEEVIKANPRSAAAHGWHAVAGGRIRRARRQGRPAGCAHAARRHRLPPRRRRCPACPFGRAGRTFGAA
jgi:putative PEP-CTERM system TPR-repeat lipoprotein